MREIEVSRLTDVIEKLCIEANEHLPEDVKCAIKNCRACEDGEIAQGVLDNIIENFEIADKECVPICQDTGGMRISGNRPGCASDWRRSYRSSKRGGTPRLR